MVLAGTARTTKRQMLGGGLLCLGIVSLHFVGMSAITIVPDATVAVPEQLLSGGMLTLAVGSITGMIILGGLGAVAIESQTSRSALERIRRGPHLEHRRKQRVTRVQGVGQQVVITLVG